MFRVGGVRRSLVIGAMAMAAIFSFSATAFAGTISVANGDFEDSYTLTHAGLYSTWEPGAPAWSTTGPAGTMEWFDINSQYTSVPAGLGARNGFIQPNASVFQSIGFVDADTSYTLSAYFGQRLDMPSFGGSFGFYVGDPSNIIGNASISVPGAGQWSLQSFTLDAALVQALVGQTIGIIFTAFVGQVNIDNIFVESFAGSIEIENVLVNPVPGAIWLFATALVGGIFGRRVKKNPA